MEGNQEEISFEEKLALAQRLSEAVDEREEFTQKFGGFDDFADVHQHVGDNRSQYDQLWANYMTARDEFDTKVADKKVLVDHLRNIKDYKLADRISMMFGTK